MKHFTNVSVIFVELLTNSEGFSIYSFNSSLVVNIKGSKISMISLIEKNKNHY